MPPLPAWRRSAGNVTCGHRAFARDGGAGQPLEVTSFAEAAKIGPTVDRFFTDVFVMADDATLRRARFQLMQQVELVILQLADVSEMVREA